MIQFVNDSDRPLFESAIHFAQQQVKRLIEKYPDYYPMYTVEGSWKPEGANWAHWSDGFLPGMMWIFFRHLGSDKPDSRFWGEQAVRYSKPLEARKTDTDLNDLGFIFRSTYHRWYQCTRDNNIRDVLIQAARTLVGRFNEKGQYLPSLISEDSVLIDSMMNVGIVFYAARETGDKRLREIATRHSITMRRFMVRADGSTAHEGIFDPETGEFLRQSTQQGYRSDSCWSRGLTWSLYGFTLAYEYSRDPRFLHTAESCADYYITHTPADGVPPWDYNAPLEERSVVDTSAAAVAAAGLLRLCRHIADPIKGHFYWSTAIAVLRTLCSRYVSLGDDGWEGVLKGGVYHMLNELGVGESVIWGDYFFVEALDEALRHMSHPTPQVIQAQLVQ